MISLAAIRFHFPPRVSLQADRARKLFRLTTPVGYLSSELIRQSLPNPLLTANDGDVENFFGCKRHYCMLHVFVHYFSTWPFTFFQRLWHYVTGENSRRVMMISIMMFYVLWLALSTCYASDSSDFDPDRRVVLLVLLSVILFCLLSWVVVISKNFEFA